MNIKEVLPKTYRPMDKEKVQSLHETETGFIFGCKSREYDCPNKKVGGHIKLAGLCKECPRFVVIKRA
jgi:hypothetical protein